MTLKIEYTPLDEIAKIHARLRVTFDSGKTLPLAYRRQQLLQLARLVQQNAHAFEDALWREFRKQPLEIAMVDLSPVVSAALYIGKSIQAENTEISALNKYCVDIEPPSESRAHTY